MKVGIVTIYDNENLGNRLQNYALQQILLRYADQVITLKNKYKFDSAVKNITRASSLAESVALNRLLGKSRKVKFLRFNRRYIHLSKHCYWYNDAESKPRGEDLCDLYCLGSDQVWTPRVDWENLFNYAGFAPGEKVFSYAASFGFDEIPEPYQAEIRKGLEHVNQISVREEAGKQIAEALSGRKDIQVVADPTLLLSVEEWDRMAEKPDAPLPQRYLLMYFLGDVSQERKDHISRLAAEHNCQIIECMDPESPFYSIGPGEFLYLIRHAEMVCTNSFHGSIFSFLWQRPLAIFTRTDDHSNTGSRIQTLVSKFHMTGHLASGDLLPDYAAMCDYSSSQEALVKERNIADVFLNAVFEAAREHSAAPLSR